MKRNIKGETRTVKLPKKTARSLDQPVYKGVRPAVPGSGTNGLPSTITSNRTTGQY